MNRRTYYTVLASFLVILGSELCAWGQNSRVNPGSSLADENDQDWSEQDNDPRGPAGSSFERRNPAREPLPPWADERAILREQVEEVPAPPPEVVVVPQEPQTIIVVPEVVVPNPAPIQATAETEPPATGDADEDVEVIYNGQ